MVNNINTNDFESNIAKGKVLVDCYADWCGPCKMLSPIIDELANEINDVNFYKLNVDENEEIASKYSIMSIPTLLIFENGELKTTSVGLKSKEELKELLK